MSDEPRFTDDEIAELRRSLDDLVLDELADGSARSRRRLVDAMAAFERRLVALEAKFQ